VWVTPDPARERILFGFPTDSENISKIWSYNYKAKAWSYDRISATMLVRSDYSSPETWGTTTGTWASATDLWNSSPQEEGVVFFGYQDRVCRYQAGRATDVDGNPITAILTSKDFDLGAPDLKKTALRLSVKIDRTLSANLSFLVEVSADRGANYVNCGQLVIPAGDDENFKTFIVSGSTIRFRLTSSSEVTEYYIENIVARVKARSLEVHLGPND